MSLITNSEFDKLLLTSNITSGFSFVGGIWIFFVFITTWKLWSYSGKMILGMNISYFLYTISNFLTNFNEEQNLILCNFDAFLRNFAILSAFYWSWKISQTAYYSVSNPEFQANKQTKPLRLLLGLTVPLAIAAFPLIGLKDWSYGFLGLHCGVKSTDPVSSLMLTLVMNVVPAGLSMISSIYYSYKIVNFAKYWGLIGISPMRLLIYSFGLFGVWFPSLIFTCVFYLTGEYFFWLDVLRVALTHLLGFTHAFLYGVQTVRLSSINQQNEENSKNANETNSLDTSFELTRSRTSIQLYTF